MTTRRVFSGIQPSGDIHIGNYMGALRNWVAMQDEYATIYCVVDLHALTLPQVPAELARARVRTAKILLAAGIDPGRSLVYYQSQVPQHAELSWIMGTFASMGQLGRMTQYKEKADRTGQNLGLLSYPVLMAADILIHKVHAVPVGDDQRQHLELTRDVAERLNNQLGAGTVVVPEAAIPPRAARVMSLSNANSKMSKSDHDPAGTVMVLDGPDEIRRKVMRAVTDSANSIRFDPDRPGIYNLLSIYQALDGRSEESIEAEFAGQGYGQLKRSVADALIESLRPLRERFAKLMAEPGQVDEILAAGMESAAPVANATRDRIYSRIGLA